METGRRPLGHGTFKRAGTWMTLAVAGLVLTSAATATAQDDSAGWLSIGGLAFE